jgi:Tol biopolymer transport system component
MEPDDNGYYHVWTMRPDGSDQRRLTASRPQFARTHQGAPFWHPSGRYILFGAQNTWSGHAIARIPDYEALPGFGRHDNLWLASADGRRLWQLTDYPNTRDEGILLPIFSPDGKHVAWSERQPGGTYILKIADFALAPQPHLGSVRSYAPGGAAYYETGSFSSDGRSLFYTSDEDTHSFWRSQIYRLDLASGNTARITIGNDYNEHPTVVSTPTGDWVVYMSTHGVQRRPWRLMLGTDWYAVRGSGGLAKRLTTMNLNDRHDPENAGVPRVAGTVAISPNGTWMLGSVQDNLVKQSGLTLAIRLTCKP